MTLYIYDIQYYVHIPVFSIMYIIIIHVLTASTYIHINFTEFIVGHLEISHHIHTWFTGIIGEVQILHKVA